MITFGDGAESALVTAARAIPSGYTVALLGDGEPLPQSSEVAYGIDVCFERADDTGVWYRLLDEDRGLVRKPLQHKTWADVARIHVY